MDNRSSENAEWDDELLGLELGDLLEGDFDLGLTGFTDEELAALMNGLSGDGTGLRRADGRNARGSGQPSWRSLGTGQSPAALWRQHGCDGYRARAWSREAAADGDRSALWRGVRSGLAQQGRCRGYQAHR